MECNEIKLNLSEYCRICLNQRESSNDKMLELKEFLPIIRFISQTKLYVDRNSPNKICESCGNGLILANILRIRVIESNKKLQTLLKVINSNKDKIQSSQDSCTETLNQNNGRVMIRQQDSSQDSSIIIKVEVEEESIQEIQENQILCDIEVNDLFDSKPDIKPHLIESETEIPQNQSKCEICDAELLGESNPLISYQPILRKIFNLKDTVRESDRICLDCIEITTTAEKLFEIREGVKSIIHGMKRKQGNLGDLCQFCLVNDIFSSKTPKYLTLKYNLMPFCKEDDENMISSESKTCKNCMQLLKKVYSLINLYGKRQRLMDFQLREESKIKNPYNIEEMSSKSDSFKKRKSKRKKRKLEEREFLDYIKSEGIYESDNSNNENQDDAIPLSKNKKKCRKKLKLRPSPKYIKPKGEAIPDDYQCHMSDFEDSDSDDAIMTPKMGDPLNVPFKHRFIKCPECKLKFITDFELEVHVDVVHRTNGTTCEHCNKKFINFVGVKAHKHKVHFANCSSVSIFRELCEICGVLTKTLEEHQSVHSDARPFVCDQCAHSSKTKDLLAAHVRAMHTGEKRYACKYCDKRFSYSADRVRHEISSHTKQYKYVCRICNKGFLKKNFLISHQKTHDGLFLDEA